MPQRLEPGRLRLVETVHPGGGDRSDEAGLLGAVARGDAAAFRTLMDRHLPAMLTLSTRMMRERAVAEDVAQEAFLRLWRSAGGIEIGRPGVSPWLRRVVANLCLDRLRVAGREMTVDELPEVPDAATQLKGLVQGEVSARVGAALAALPDRQRQALALFHYEDMSQAEIAEVMSISQDAVESLLARARRQLRQALKDEWAELSIGGGE